MPLARDIERLASETKSGRTGVAKLRTRQSERIEARAPATPAMRPAERRLLHRAIVAGRASEAHSPSATASRSAASSPRAAALDRVPLRCGTETGALSRAPGALSVWQSTRARRAAARSEGIQGAGARGPRTGCRPMRSGRLAEWPACQQGALWKPRGSMQRTTVLTTAGNAVPPEPSRRPSTWRRAASKRARRASTRRPQRSW